LIRLRFDHLANRGRRRAGHRAFAVVALPLTLALACSSGHLGTVGSGGAGGSSGIAGAGGGSGGAGGSSGIAGAGGAGTVGSAAAGGSSAVGGAGGSSDPSITTDPWPTTCIEVDAGVARPADESLVTGPSNSPRAGDPALAGDMTATMNGFARSFSDRFDISVASVSGYSFDGALTVSVPSLAPGIYRCPDARIGYSNFFNSALRERNVYASDACCTVEITQSGDAGDAIEGTFSGILVTLTSDYNMPRWLNIEDGHFRVVRRATDAGTDQ
jgi:hypothetical protein